MSTLSKYLEELVEKCKDFINHRFPEYNEVNNYIDIAGKGCESVITTLDNLRSNVINLSSNACQADMKYRTFYLKGSQYPIKYVKDQFRVSLEVDNPFYSCIDIPKNMCVNGEIEIYFQLHYKNKTYTEYHKYKYYAPNRREPEILKLIDYNENDKSVVENTALMIEKEKNKLKLTFKGKVYKIDRGSSINIKGNAKLNFVSFD
jgi:hypothetical protein